MTALIISVLAAALYLGAAYYQMKCLGRRLEVNVNLLRGLGAIALFLHAMSLYVELSRGPGLSLGFFNASSLIAWLIIALTLLSSLGAPTASLLLGLFPLGAVTALLSSLLPDHGAIRIAGQQGLLTHIMLSILAYGILTIAAFQAVLLAVQDHQLRHKHPTRFIRTFPPLQTMERLLFQFLLCGEVLLTLALISGFIYLENMFAQGVAHKTFLSCLAWVMFGILLWGRYVKGWRGSKAIRWTLAGFLLLMLAYYGTKLVHEFVLPL